MISFQKKKQKQNLPGFRTPDFFKNQTFKPKNPSIKSQVRLTQHKG